MANVRDLAVGSVLTAPSPATSGTTLVLQSGQGADMPTDLPFKLLVFPTGAVPSKANSEKVLVTARSTDTLTIVRAQGETTAKNIASGWLVANAIFTEDIFNSSSVTGEVPTGTINGSNTAFTLASNPTTGSVRVFLNGVRLKLTDDYTISNSTITFVTAPPTGSNLLVDYAVGTMANSVGTNSFIMKETPTGSVNGSNAVFTTARAYIAGSLQVYVNGLMQGPTHVTETTPGSGIFTLDVAPTTGDTIHVSYQYNLNPSSNADTVDGIHASSTATANQLIPLGSDAKFPTAVIPGYAFRARRVAALSSTSGSSIAVIFDTAAYNYGSAYSTSTGLFTAPVNGVYSFAWGFFSESTTTTRVFASPRGTVTTGGSGFNETATRYADASMTTYRYNGATQIYMAAGQTFGLEVWMNAVNALNVPDTWFAGHLVMAV